jgi:hypothetical protein
MKVVAGKGTLIPGGWGRFHFAAFPMVQWGIKVQILVQCPDSPMDIEGILSFAKAASAMKRLRHARLGMIGYNDIGLYSTGLNPTRLRSLIGPELKVWICFSFNGKWRPSLLRKSSPIYNGYLKTGIPLGKPAEGVVENASLGCTWPL